MTDRELMQQALDALTFCGDPEEAFDREEAAAEALRARLAQPDPEPVAWISDSPTKGSGKQLHWTKAAAYHWSSNITPLYTAPPVREWQWLTDEDEDRCRVDAGAAYQRHIRNIRGQQITPADDYEWHLIRAIEARLKEKNK